MGKVLLLFFGTFLLVLTGFSFWWGEWELGYYFLKFRHFPNISNIPALSRSATREATRL